MSRLALVPLVLAVVACSAEQDRRFLTPESTVHALFTAYGVEEAPERAILARMQEGGRFEPEDTAGYRECFADYRSAADEGAAGYVFGLLAAGKDHLRYERDGETATVLPTNRQGEGAPRVTLRRTDGAWKIVLRESVPPDVRARLFQIYGRAEEQAARTGAGAGR